MGTSSSSGGPGPDVPMVPPWVPDSAPPGETPPNADPAGEEEGSDKDDSAGTSTQAVPMAPKGRFRGARTGLGKFAESADTRGMRRGLGHYVRKGYGGASTATRRFGNTAQTAGILYGALSSAGRRAAGLPGGDIDPAILDGRAADDVMNAVVEAVRPIDGTQDAEASRVAIKDALSELLTRYPDAVLLELTEEQRLFAAERYVALDVYRRIQLDVGKVIQAKAPTHKAGLARLKEVKNYVKETVSEAFRRLATGAALTARQVVTLSQRALKETFTVFESYLQ